MMQRPRGKSPMDGRVDVWRDDAFKRAYPIMWEYLALEMYDDGSTRERSTLTLVIEEGQWKAGLNDRDQSRSLWASSDSMEGVLASLEAGLASDVPSWRRHQQWRAKKQPKGT